MNNIIKKILDENYKYKINKFDGIESVYFENETILAIIKNTKNVFKINRNQFEKIDNELLPYAFLLIDISKNEYYFMKYKEPNNFLRNSFERSKKDEIYFGKEILQNKIRLNELKGKIDEIENI